MAPQTPTTERIDGRPYLYGSREHHDAIERAIKDRVDRLTGSGIAGALINPYTGERADANQTAFLARELVYVSRDIQVRLYEKLRAAEFVPISTEVPEGAEMWTYKQRDRRGKARVGAHLEASDAPRVDVNYEEFPFPVTYADAAYAYTIEDMKKAAFAGVPLIRDKADACAEAIAEKLDELIRIGDAEQGIPGFLNNPNVPVVTLTKGEWLTATDADILFDLQEVEQDFITDTRDVEEGTRLILPTAYEGRLRTLKVTDSERTVAQYFFGSQGQPGNSRMLRELERWIALDDATGEDVGVDDPPQGVAYKPDPAIVCAHIVNPYAELPPETRGFGWIVPAYAVFAGTVFKRPQGARYIENLD